MIRPAFATDRDAIWEVIKPVFREGTTYAVDRKISRQQAMEYWLESSRECYVAEAGGNVVGTYYLRTNHAGGGSHVCNCGYIVSAAARGKGLASQMCKHSLSEARALGYRAMQFNFVLETNTGAIAIWERHGFEIIGRSPKAFDHPDRGLVDALLMHREL